jgi:hypothetical protein
MVRGAGLLIVHFFRRLVNVFPFLNASPPDQRHVSTANNFREVSCDISKTRDQQQIRKRSRSIRSNMARTSPQKGGGQERRVERQITSMEQVPVFSSANLRDENNRCGAMEPAFNCSNAASLAKEAQQSGRQGPVDPMTRLLMRDATNQASQLELNASRDGSVMPAKGVDEALSSSVGSDSQSAMLPSIPVKPVVPIAPLPTLLPRSLATEPGPSEENLTHARFVREALDMVSPVPRPHSLVSTAMLTQV